VTIHCQESNDLFPRYSADDLPRREREALRRHLASCPGCREEYARFQATIGLLDSLEEKEPPADLWSRVEQEITRPQKHTSRLLRGLPRLGWARLRPAVAWGVGVVAIAVFLILAPLRPRGGRDASLAAATYVEQHTALAGEDPLADRVALGIISRLAESRRGD
jgi:anti-sigma factor RsiW